MTNPSVAFHGTAPMLPPVPGPDHTLNCLRTAASVITIGSARPPPAIVIFIVSPFADRPGANVRRATSISALDTLNSMSSRYRPGPQIKSTREEHGLQQ